MRGLLSLDLETTAGKDTFPEGLGGKEEVCDVATTSSRGVRHFLAGADLSKSESKKLEAVLVAAIGGSIVADKVAGQKLPSGAFSEAKVPGPGTMGIGILSAVMSDTKTTDSEPIGTNCSNWPVEGNSEADSVGSSAGARKVLWPENYLKPQRQSCAGCYQRETLAK